MSGGQVGKHACKEEKGKREGNVAFTSARKRNPTPEGPIRILYIRQRGGGLIKEKKEWRGGLLGSERGGKKKERLPCGLAYV